jgi:hypothetical protein
VTEIAVQSGECLKCGQQGNTWQGVCYECMMAGKAGHVWGNARTQKTITPERTFASATEARCAQWLQLRERAGEISDLEYQVEYVLSDTVKVVIDFRYVENGQTVLLDAKAVGKPDRKHKRPWYVSMTSAARVKYKWLEKEHGLHVNLWPPLEGK